MKTSRASVTMPEEAVTPNTSGLKPATLVAMMTAKKRMYVTNAIVGM